MNSGSAGRWPRWLPPARTVLQDPLTLSAVVCTALACVLFVVVAGQSGRQSQVFWAFQVPLDALMAYAAGRVARCTTGAIRRFWRLVTVAGTLFVLGDSVQTVTVLVDPTGPPTTGGTFQSTCFAVGLGTIVCAMLLHPNPGRSGRERIAFWLDAATVLIGGAVVAWCFAVTPDSTGRTDVFGVLVNSAMALTAAFAAVKLTLSGNAPMHRAAAFTLTSAAVTMSIGIFLVPAGSLTPAPLVFVIQFLPSLPVALGPRLQDLFARFDARAFAQPRRKPYSLLPYGSIAVAFGAMVVILPQGTDARLWGVVTGLALICALVVIRQLTAFHDNTRLIRQLDTTLWELREHEARLRHQALHDGLTGLANRTHFHDEVRAELAVSSPATVSLLLIDLDGFKEVNDTLGHSAGDALLAAVADRLREAVRRGDLVARLGGDEFAVLLRDCGTWEAENTAERILRELHAPVTIRGRTVRTNASIGVAYAKHGDEVESLLRDADIAMYAAKHVGKGTWRRYHESMGAGALPDATARR